MDKTRGFFRKVSEWVCGVCRIWLQEMKSTFRDEGVLMFFVLVPIAYPLLYSWIYTNEVVREVPVVVVDKSRSRSSREFIRSFDASPDVKVAYYRNSIAEAKDIVGHQDARGILYFPPDYENDIYRNDQAHVSVYCDMALMLTYKAIYQAAQNVSTEINKEIRKSEASGFTDRDDELNADPIKIDEIQIFNPAGGYGSALLPAVLVLILQQTLMLGIGLSAGTAREKGSFKAFAPINNRHYNGIFSIVFGKSACYFMIYAVIAVYITLAVPYFFSFTALASGADLLGLMVPYLLACIFFGMTFSCLVRYRENVMLLVVFTSVPFLFMTGISWPQPSIPGMWQGVSWLIPSTFGVRGFLRVSSMGGTIHDIEPELRNLWIQAGIYFITTCIVYRCQISNALKNATECTEKSGKSA